MREYALTLAQPTLSQGLIPQALQCVMTALLRRKIRKVLLGAGICPVTGLAGGQLRHLLSLPLSCDPQLEIERIKFISAKSKMLDRK